MFELRPPVFWSGSRGIIDLASTFCPKVFEQFLFQRPAGLGCKAAIDRFVRFERLSGVSTLEQANNLCSGDHFRFSLIDTVRAKDAWQANLHSLGAQGSIPGSLI
ncbi:hypothetical protein ASC90_20540 [Rhizobium sp. Root1220]|nr:hypothetical protein ASC90_20540 [Rhizobium sp. Root1220]